MGSAATAHALLAALCGSNLEAKNFLGVDAE